MREYALGTDKVLGNVTVDERKFSKQLASHLGRRQNSRNASKRLRNGLPKRVYGIPWLIGRSIVGWQPGEHPRFRVLEALKHPSDLDRGGGLKF